MKFVHTKGGNIAAVFKGMSLVKKGGSFILYQNTAISNFFGYSEDEI